MKRKVEIVVLSDIHLGTYGCHAAELNNYLRSVTPRTLVLNGDIFDIWNFKKNYFPKEHLDVVRRIIKLAVNGTKVYYLTGNHDDVLRKFGEFSLGIIHLRNKLLFQIDGKKHWIFHGDVFDSSIQRARWLARLGGKGYDLLIRINRMINVGRSLFGLGPVSFAAKVKKGVKGAVKFIDDFEKTAVQIAAERDYDYVICGHIHKPQIKKMELPEGKSITYLNSGDWVEHLTALEYDEGKWSLYQYDSRDYISASPMLQVKTDEKKQLTLSREEVSPTWSAAAFELI